MLVDMEMNLIALVQEGDKVVIDIESRSLDALLSDEDIKLRKEKWNAGFTLNFGFQFNRENNSELWKPTPEEKKHMSYEEYSGEEDNSII